MLPRNVAVLIIAMLVVLVSCSLPVTAQTSKALPAEVRKQIRDMDKAILAAGRLFKDKKFEDSAKRIAEAQSSMEEMAKSADARTIEVIKGTYKKLSKAHSLLTGKGQTLKPLAPLPDPEETVKVSFVSQVAPILVSKCGNCHVNERRGNFSAASFRNLDNSAMIAYGEADESRLIEVIESGEMPPTNRKVSKAELAALKQWVNEGAEFDGTDPTVNIGSFAAPRESESMTAGPQRPTGDETVSFALHIAPILLENCTRCHIADNPAANFSMATFASILRGGDSGEDPFMPGKSATSEIILRLKGLEGLEIMPPTGKLDDKLIAMVEKWIDEGAKFEPVDLRVPLKTVAAKGLANSLDHKELVEWRKGASEDTWRLALASVKPTEAALENFLVLGTGSETRLQKIGKVAEKLADGVAKILGAPKDQPFVKGRTTLFVVAKRYDFAEFGRMVERRTFAKSLVSSWQSDTAIAHVVLKCGINDVAADYEVSLARDIASVHVANWNASVPRWFADGMGYWVASKMFRRSPVMLQWQSDADAAVAGMDKPDDFLGNNMATDQAALVGYRFVELLQGKSRQSKLLMKSLREGNNFDLAFEDAYGTTPAAFFNRQGRR